MYRSWSISEILQLHTRSLLVVVFACWLGAAVHSEASAQPRDARADRSGEQTLRQVYDGIRNADVASLSEVAADRIDLTILGTGEVLSRSQARYVLQNFFRTYPPTEVSVDETSPSQGNWFASGHYWYEGSTEPMTIYVRMRSTAAGGWELRELRFGMPISR